MYAKRGRPLESANMLEYNEFRELFSGTFSDRYYALNGRRIEVVKTPVARSDYDDAARAAFLAALSQKHPRCCCYCGEPITRTEPNVEPDEWRPAIHAKCKAEKASVSEIAA
jgi:hypothetical protein